MHGSWTDEQLAAINSKGENLLVSAAAGSGKTAVLIERIIRIITEESPSRVDIDRLLVVTFTKAAASEMRGRLMERLSEMQRSDRENVILQRQIALLPRASISTFDALCQKIVRENFVGLNIDPSFKVGNDEELHLLRMQALDDVFEQSYENGDFRALIEAVCEHADDFELRNAVMEVFEFIQSEREPLKWLIEKSEAYNIESLDGSFYSNAAFEYAISELSAALSFINKALEAAENPSGPTEYQERLSAEVEMIRTALVSKSYSDLAESVKNIFFDRLPQSRSECVSISGEDLKETAKSNRDEAKKRVASVRDKYFFKAENQILSDIKNAYPVLKTLSETVSAFSERYMELKKERRILSFSDIKLLCYEALVKDNEFSDAALQYQNQFRYVLVDEYQDTNDVEEGILEAVSGRGAGNDKRFMVGDVKQSIYRFRRSKPELFIGKSEEYSRQTGGRLITLHRNFRSKSFILNAVNFIFSQIMRKKAAEIEYDRSAELISGQEADKPCGAVKVTLIETDELSDESGETSEAAEALNELKALEVEALYIADEIFKLVSGGMSKLGDIVILMRSGKSNGALFSEALSSKGIPSLAEGKTGYFEMTEISDMLALLNIIDNPLQEIPLITALTSPIFNFSPDELIEIRSIQKGSFYDALAGYAEARTESELSQKTAGFISRLAGYRKMAARIAVGELLSFLYDDTDYYILAGAMENGAFRQANLRDLLKRASDFEKSTFPGLFHFVRYMERLKEQNLLGQAEPSPGSGSGDSNDSFGAVRIMTIHKSKGLEFPVVFLAGCGSRFNLRDLSNKFILHQELGYGASYVDYENRVKSGTLPRSVVAEKLRREALAEEMRLLYVAMTRAKERLYMSGNSGKDAEKKIKKWLSVSNSNGEVFSPEAILSAASYLDWIMPSVLRSPSSSCFLTEYGLSSHAVANDYLSESKFDIEIARRSETSKGEESVQRLSRMEFEREISEIVNKPSGSSPIDIDKLMNWKYNYEADTVLPAKLSVSEIKTQFQRLIAGEAETGLYDYSPPEKEQTLSRPDFLRETKTLSPAEKGTAVHAVLARLDLESARGAEDVRGMMDTLLAKKLLNEKEYESINIPDITAFLKSDIAERIRRSKNVRREIPFVIGISPEEAYFPASDEIVLVHGIIDCFFEENEKIIILDYKTDYVSTNSFEEIKQKYKIQLAIYTKAAELITQKPVGGAYLYMMRYGLLIDMKEENGETQ